MAARGLKELALHILEEYRQVKARAIDQGSPAELEDQQALQAEVVAYGQEIEKAAREGLL